MIKKRNIIFALIFLVLFLIGCSNVKDDKNSINNKETQSNLNRNSAQNNNLPETGVIENLSLTTPKNNIQSNQDIKVNQQDGDNTKEFYVEISHNTYTPKNFAVNKGDKVRFLMIASRGTLNHNHGITIDEYNINQAATTEDPLKADKIEFIADKQGTFKIYCKTCWDGPFGRGHPDIQASLVVQ